MTKREWERAYNKWLDDPVINKKPGSHPEEDHPWNTDSEIVDFCIDEIA